MGGIVVFFVLFAIAAIIKTILQRRVADFKKINLEISAASSSGVVYDFPIAAENHANRPRYQSFNVFDEFGYWEPYETSGHFELWNFSKSIYLNALFNPDNRGLYNSFFKFWTLKVLPFLEKYIPAFLFLGFVEYFLFDATGLFISTLFYLILLSGFSFFLALTRLPFLSRVKSGVNLDRAQNQIQILSKALLTIHFSSFYRCFGLFWRMVYVFKWLFRE